jgi:hypothetical protein
MRGAMFYMRSRTANIREGWVREGAGAVVGEGPVAGFVLELGRVWG